MYNKIDTRSKIYLIFAFLGIVLLSYSIWQIKPVIVDVDSLGLASYLTLTYWIGFVLIIACSIKLYLDNEKNDSIYIIYLITIALFLFGVSIFVEENARSVWSYYPTAEVKTILDINKIDKISEYPIISYRSWPGSHLVSASIIYFANVKIGDMIKYMPIFWAFMLAFIAYGTGKILKLQANQCFMISIFMLSSLWVANYYSPQSIGYILYSSFFVSIILAYRNITYTGSRHTGIDDKNDISIILIILLIFAATVTVHMLTSIALIVAFYLTSYLKKFFSGKDHTDLLHKNRIKIIILFMTIFVAWYIYVASSMFSAGINDLVRQMTEGQMFSIFKTEKYSSGVTLARQIIHNSRIAYMGIYIIAMIVAAILYFKKSGKEKNNEFIKICFLWLVGISTLLMFRYGAEIDDRVYIYSLLPMILIIVMTFGKRVVVILAILLILLHIPAHYGTESYDMIYTTELQGSKFIGSNMNFHNSINYYNGRLIVYFNPQLIPYIRGTGSDKGIYNPDNASLNNSDYIVDSKQDSNILMYLFGADIIKTWLQEDDRTNLLYDNGYFSLYENRKNFKK